MLRSAVANAESSHGLDGDELVVEAAYADEGPTLKRWRARARGRVNRIRKRTCHVTVKVEQLEDVAPATEGKGAGERGSTPRSRRRSAGPSRRRARPRAG